MLRSHQAVVIGLAAAVACGAASAAEPRTLADIQRDIYIWAEKKLLDDFDSHVRKDAPWAAEYRKFLTDWAAGAGQAYQPATMEKLGARAAALAAAGCDDPILGLLRARIDIACGRPKEALASLQRLPDLKKAGYSDLMAYWAIIWSRRARTEINPADKAVPNPNKVLNDLSIGMAGDRSLLDGRQWIYPAMLMPDSDDFLAAAAEQFARPDSGVDPWIAALVTGRHHIRRAWAARGGSFANQVKPAGWKGFAEHLAIAREQLVRAHEMHPEWPQAACDMITVSLGEGSDEQRLWFDRAVAAEFDFSAAYKQMLRHVLLPRWGGSHEAMLDFGRECLATGRFDTQVPSYMYEAVIGVGAELPDARDAVAMPGVYDACARTCRGYIAAAASPETVRLWQSRLAVLAWAAGRHTDACEALDALRDDIVPDPLLAFRAQPADVVGESRLGGGPHAETFAAAEALVEKNRLEEALAAYRPLATRNDLNPVARWVVTGRIKALENAVALDSYQWVDLQPPADMKGWRPVFGGWRLEKDGTLFGWGDQRGRVKILCESELGPDVELSAECDLTTKPNREKPWSHVTMLLAHTPTVDRGTQAVGVRLEAPSQLVRVARWGDRGLQMQDPDALQRQVEFDGKTDLRIVLWDGKLSAFVNGKKAVDKVELPPEWLEGGGLGIAEGTPLRIRSFRARKLDKPPEDF
jgi:hypothetical protein